MSCVYRLTFPDGSVYIGRSDGNPKDRWRDGWGYSQSSMVFKAIFYFGWKNVKKEVIASGLTHDESVEMENHEIAVHSAVCTVHNEYVPAQSFPQSDAQISTYAQSVVDEDDKVDLLDKRRAEIQKTTKRKYVIPLVPKPLGIYRCPIDVYDTKGRFIRTYPDSKSASDDLNVNQGSIASCCKGMDANGKLRYSTGGYIFRYHNPDCKTD